MAYGARQYGGGAGITPQPVVVGPFQVEMVAQADLYWTPLIFLGVANVTASVSVDVEATEGIKGLELTAAGTMTAVVAKSYSISAEFASAAGLDFFLPFPHTVDPAIGKEPYRLVIVDAYGTRYAELEKATINEVTWVLNDLGSVSFDLPLDDPKAAECIVPEREVQVWRGTQIIWWGVLVRARGTDTSVNFQAQSLEWYFTRRVIGAVPIPNRITNGNFELEEAGWTFEYGNLEPDKSTGGVKTPSHTIDTVTVLSGKRSLRLASTLTSNHKWAKKQYRYTNSTGRPVKATAVAWSYTDSFTGPAAGYHGLVLARYDTAVLDPHPNLAAQGLKKIHQYISSSIDQNTPLDTWVRHEVEFEIPPDYVAYDIAVRLHTPNGVVFWDEVSLTFNEPLYLVQDQSAIVQSLVAHAQDTAIGKSALNIGTYTLPTGVVRTREYLTQDRQQVSEALWEFATLANGMDIDMMITPTTRQVRTHYPRKGTDVDKPALMLGVNVLTFTVDVDAEQTASTVIVQADGEGTDREEGVAQDPSLLNGLVLETVYNATPGSSVSSLQAQADRGLARYRRPVTIPSVTCHQKSEELLSVLQPGDVTVVVIRKGWLDVLDKYRIVGISLVPATEEITYTLAAEDDPIGIISDWAAEGWKYLARAQAPTYTASNNEVPVETDTDFAASDFDDSSWSTGRSPMGWAFGSGGFQGNTVRNTELTDGTELWMRKTFQVTGDMFVYTKADNFAYLYVNGHKIVDPYIESRDASDAYVERGPFRVPQEYLNPNGDQVVALHVQDKLSGYAAGDVLVGDVKVLGTYDQYVADTYVPPLPASAEFPAPSALAYDSFDGRSTTNPRSDGGLWSGLGSHTVGSDILTITSTAGVSGRGGIYSISAIQSHSWQEFLLVERPDTATANVEVGAILGSSPTQGQYGIYVGFNSMGTYIVEFINNDQVRRVRASGDAVPNGTYIRVEHDTTANTVTVKNALTGVIIVSGSYTDSWAEGWGLYAARGAVGKFDSWSAGRY